MEEYPRENDDASGYRDRSASPRAPRGRSRSPEYRAHPTDDRRAPEQSKKNEGWGDVTRERRSSEGWGQPAEAQRDEWNTGDKQDERENQENSRGNRDHRDSRDDREHRDHRDSREHREADREDGVVLFVKGLSTRTENKDLSDIFVKYGTVTKVNIMYDPHDRQSRGFGFVTIATDDEAQAAIDALHGQEVHGRAISVERAKRGRPRTPTPGRYYGQARRRHPLPPKPFSSRDYRGDYPSRDSRDSYRDSGPRDYRRELEPYRERDRDDYRSGGYDRRRSPPRERSSYQDSRERRPERPRDDHRSSSRYY